LKSLTRESTALEKRPFQSCSAIVKSLYLKKCLNFECKAQHFMHRRAFLSSSDLTGTPVAPTLGELASEARLRGLETAKPPQGKKAPAAVPPAMMPVI
jgi:hypothetical protein